MEVSPFKKAVCWIFLVGILLVLAACTTIEPFGKTKPVSKMTTAEIEEQDPSFWCLWKERHGM